MTFKKTLAILIGIAALVLSMLYYRTIAQKEKTLAILKNTQELTEFDFSGVYSNNMLPIKLKPTTWPGGCVLGDWDGLDYSLKLKPNNGMIASFERIDQRMKKANFFTLTRKTLQADINLKFQLPDSNEPSLWGFFICNDKNKQHFCYNKRTINIGKLITSLHANRNYADKLNQDDHVFLFLMAYLIDGRLFFFKQQYRDLGFLNTAMSTLEKFGPYQNQDLFLKNLQERNNLLMSSPFELQDKKYLVVSLPKINRAQCSAFLTF